MLINKRVLYHFMQKKGLSEVISTLILIGLSLAAVVIIWVVIQNIINKGTDEVSIEKYTINLELKSAYANESQLFVKVKRNPGQGNLNGLKFIFSDGTNSGVVDRKNIDLQELGEKTFDFPFAEIGLGSVKEVSISPIFVSESGAASFGGIVSEIELAPLGGEAGPGTSCFQIRRAGSTDNGLYYIKPEGYTGGAFQVYCDMQIDEGGWTLVARTDQNLNGAFGWRNATGSVTDFSQAYSLNVYEKNLTFTEILYGQRASRNNNSWGYNVYKKTDIPATFIEDYYYNGISLLSGSVIKGGLGQLPVCQQYFGYTNRTNNYFMRNVISPGAIIYGLNGTALKTSIDCVSCGQTGNNDVYTGRFCENSYGQNCSWHAMLMVR